ncbi:MAG: YigZ family protein [Aminobacteriaceae bacterium]
MTDRYRQPAAELSNEIKIEKSRFIASIKICISEEEAREKLKAVSEEHRQASHNCWAYRIGTEKVREYFSDDGEPAGTAGKPILGALHMYDVTNTLLVVTRYFGGKKLGVRGLIEAYGTSASELLSMTGIVEKRRSVRYVVVMPYDMIKLMERLLDSCEAPREEQVFEYASGVSVTCLVPEDMAPQFESTLEEWKNTGRIRKSQLLSS